MRHSQNLRLSRKPSCHLTAFSSFGTSGKQSKAKSFSKSCFPKPSTTTPCPPPPLLLAVAQAREPSLLCAVGLQESAQCQQHWAAAKQPKPGLPTAKPRGLSSAPPLTSLLGLCRAILYTDSPEDEPATARLDRFVFPLKELVAEIQIQAE